MSIADEIMNNAKEKDRTHPCYEVALRKEIKNSRVIREDNQRNESKSISPEEFVGYMQFIIDELEKFRNKPYVMMENKNVWFDRKTAGLFPRFETVELPSFSTIGRPIYNISAWRYEGFQFYPMTPEECLKSFTFGSENPYLDEDGNFKYFPTRDARIILVIGWKNNKSLCINSNGERHFYSDIVKITMVPICRLNGINSNRMSHGDAVRHWLINELIPEPLSKEAKQAYIFLMKIFESVAEYFNHYTSRFEFNEEKFLHDVDHGKISVKDLIAKGSGKSVSSKSNKPEELQPIDLVCEDLCKCDYIRANIEPYDKKILTDVNGGHWELYEPVPADAEKISLPADEPFFARPPHLDVKNGIVAIDFGTKATVVVRQVGTDEKLLRIGQGNYSEAPKKSDYENPTVIELCDYESFKKAYDNRIGRPFTEWQQATFSHTANAVLNDAEKDSSIDNSVFYSIFSELKQWANDKDRRMYLQDRNKKLVELNPYLQLEENDFDPIELYAYYLGLYINNMRTGICLEYMFSFPVNYENAVREKILQSFEKGIKKSLPPAILNDSEIMKKFRFYAGASEPAAYASCALGELKLQPKQGEKTAYAVFDFGGGTTDFDFGIESVPANKRSKFVIDQLGSSGHGDPYLGGENLLNRLAYEVYKSNLKIMREKQIPFALPYECTAVDGGETIIINTKEAYVNRKRIAEFLRPFWEEREDESDSLFNEQQKIKLYSKTDDKIISVDLELTREILEDCLKTRIKRGVDSFFEALIEAFGEADVLPIHILLAGNSCKSSIVRNLFEEKITEKELELEEIIFKNSGEKKSVENVFVLHMPLGFEPNKTEEITDAQAESNNENDEQSEMKNFERLRTGKTGVAFGLLRSRKGGRDVKLVGIQKEAPFPYYLGSIDEDGNFKVDIKIDVPYGEWKQFTFADEDSFEIYFTKESVAIDGQIPKNEVNVVRCDIDEDDISDGEDTFVFVRKSAPDMIEYTVGRAEDLNEDNFGGKIYQQRIAI